MNKVRLAKKKNLLLLFQMLVMCGVVFATGPSYIESEIRPVSINDKGDVLCRSRFTKNEMGAQKAMKIIYGYCIITTDTIIQIKTQEIDPDGFPDYDTFSRFTQYWDSIFNSCFDKKHLSEIGYTIKKRYHFDSCNIKPYQVNKTQTLSQFEDTKNIDLDAIHQKALNGSTSTDYYDTKKVHVLYDFGKIVLLNNVNNEYEGTQIGADFDYYNPWINEEGDVKNIGFDISDITGILILNEP